MKILKTFAVFLISFPTLVFACGSFDYGTYYIERGYNILHNGLVSNEFRRVTNSQLIPFYNDKENKQLEITRKINIKEWADYLNKSKDDAEKIIYAGENTDGLNTEMLQYLAFIKQVEPLVDYDNSWDRDTQKDILQKYNAGIELAESSIQQTQSDFLKLRYFFGAMRLAHYSKQYDKEQTLYEKYNNKLSGVNSEVQYWIAALKAGLDQHQGKKAQAAYQFAQLFKESKTKRYTAYVGFSIKSDTEWKELMSLCKSNDEKALMNFIRALKPKANSLQELKQIYELAPNSVWLDALLARELEYVQFAKQIMENRPGSWYSYSLDINKKMLISDVDQYDVVAQKLDGQKITRRSQYIDNLSQIVQQIKTEGKHNDIFLAEFADVYLKLLSQKQVSLEDVGKLQIKYADDPRVAYLESLKLFVYLEHIPTINPQIESEISIYLERIKKQEDGGLSFEDILAYTYIKLEPLYEQEKNAFKHYISKYRGIFNPDNILVFEIRELKKLQEKTDKNLLEKQMLASVQYFLDESQNYGNATSLDRITVKKYLSAGLFSKADAILENLPSKMETEYNPFNNVLSGNNRAKSKPLDTHTFVKKLVSISDEIAQNPENAGSHYLLANAYYNMSWFGNSPMLTRYYRATTDWSHGNTNLDRAKKHYQLAYQTAQDDEIKVKSLYALEKISFNEKSMEAKRINSNFELYDYTGKLLKTGMDQLKAQQFGEYFKKIDQYKNTAYYNDVIKQCAIYNSSSW